MSAKQQSLRNQERIAKLTVWMAGRSSRNKTLLDKICRWAIVRKTSVPPEEDFMRDEFIDNDQGFDPEELERFQRGETGP